MLRLGFRTSRFPSDRSAFGNRRILSSVGGGGAKRCGKGSVATQTGAAAKSSVIFAEKEVGGCVLVLIAREVGLDDHELRKAECFQLQVEKEEKMKLKLIIKRRYN